LGDLADCFDQETYGPSIPIDPIDRRFPVLGQHIGGMARFHAQSRERARWRLHDRPFDQVETSEDRLDPSRESAASDFFVETLNVGVEFRGEGVESFLEG
jgi:hypothetical protein